MTEKSAGGVVINKGRVAIVSQRGTSFSLPKGQVREGESLLNAAYREIYEETGIRKDELEFIKELETYTRPSGRTGNPKDICMFLFRTSKRQLNPVDENNPSASWVEINKVKDNLTYREDMEFFLRHIKDY